MPFLKKADLKKSAYFLPVAVFLAMLPVTMIVPVFKEIVKDRFQSGNGEVAWFLSVAMLGSFVFSPIAGFLSDYFETRKKLIVLFCGLDALLLNLLPYAENLTTLLLFRFLEGGAHVFVIGLLFASVADFEHGKSKLEYGSLIGLSGMLLSLGGAVGLFFGFLGKRDPTLPFRIGSGILLFLGWIVYRFVPEEKLRYSKKHSWKESGVFFLTHPLLLFPLAFQFLDRFTSGYFMSSLNLRLRENFLLNPSETGKMLSLVFLPMALLSYPAIRLSQRTGTYFPVAVGSLIYGVSLILSGIFQSVTWIGVSLLFCGLGAGLMFSTSLRLASSLCKRENNGLVMTGLMGFGSLGFFLGPISSVELDRVTWVPFFESSFTAFVFGFAQILIVLASIPFYKILNKK
ncbi:MULTISPECIES: MFS transporter [Leptospira]|uniref:MFS transporter n=4 Tax=Leptospira santarosai TaxID=28183 RepID=A0AB73M410_9LEPT|nr:MULTISPECIES: MFS transporter [Leptospira]AVV52150.1 Transporter, major facilitator domain protein [Leptospira santarosai]AVV81137.1 Transporter, major facilitator domain protein [Leptospira santarosai]EKO32562.1 transporter, major facilitator domain protein [Leptospira santarosai str. MOR084]EKO76327.1 transporter, major facilitator domain protein [Leptospira sp. Fiocruz LV3954]EKR90180.1 transporter, major facilitator domain protein [Leptospira santarosai str. CBC379]